MFMTESFWAVHFVLQHFLDTAVGTDRDTDITCDLCRMMKINSPL